MEEILVNPGSKRAVPYVDTANDDEEVMTEEGADAENSEFTSGGSIKTTARIRSKVAIEK